MIIGSGIDMVEIRRIQHSVDRYGSRFLDRVFTASEQAYCLRKRNSAESFAARHQLRRELAGDRGGP
jgi:holo-[acyl-carrier protein] synthase